MKEIKEKRWKQNLPHFAACVSSNTYCQLCILIFTILFYVPKFIKNGNKTLFFSLLRELFPWAAFSVTAGAQGSWKRATGWEEAL